MQPERSGVEKRREGGIRGGGGEKGRGERNQIVSLFCLKFINISHCTGNKLIPTLPSFIRHHMNWLLAHFSKPPLRLHSALATGLLEAPIKCWALFCLLAFAFVLFATFYLPYFHVTGSFSPSVLMFPFLHLVYLLGSTYCYLKLSCWHILCLSRAEFKTSQGRNTILHYWRPSQ